MVAGAGLGPPRKPDNEIMNICRLIRPKLEGKLSKPLSSYEPVLYRTQMVNGINYFIKINIGSNQCIHIRIYCPLGGEAVLVSFQENKTKSDKVEYFD